MSFLQPFWLFFIPAVLLFYLLKRKKTLYLPFPKAIIIQENQIKYHLIPLLLSLLLVALSHPVLDKKSSFKSPQTTLFIALDTSASMRAQDIKPDRFEASKKAIHRLIDTLDAKIAILAFTSNPLLLAPPTSDKRILHLALESLNPDYILTKSTDIQKLLDFVSKFGESVDLVLFSDGGEGDIEKPKNVHLFFVATASKEGSLIPTKDGYLKQDGKLVVTKLNRALLKKADFTYTLSNFLKIKEDTQAKKTTTQTKEYLDLTFIPLAFAILLYLYIFTTLFERFKKAPLFLLLVVTLKAGIIEEWQIKKGYDYYKQKEYKKAALIFQKLPYFEAKYALALSLIKLGRYHQASQILSSLHSTDPKIKAQIYYHLGFCYEKMRNFDKAKEAYAKATALKNKEALLRLEKIIFTKNQKKQPLPFTKQKVVKKESKKSGDKSKEGGTSNMQSALMASSGKGGKKNKKEQVLTKSGQTMPLSSKVYETINKGYIHEKTPW